MKREYTDKYVLVDPVRPELARFRDVVGRVKTVNMNGQALVEFDDYHLNTGWFDIAPEFLKVVDKPPPKAPKVEKKPAAKAEAKPVAAKAPAAKAPAKPQAAAGKSSVADILAAARAGKAAPAKTAGEMAKAETTTAKAAPAASATGEPAKVDRSKMSVAEMLAAARGGGAPAAKPGPATAIPAEPAAEEEVAEPPAESPAPAAAATGDVRPVDKSKMTIDQMIAYCREHDAK
jgi:hypothetical protein